jgi:hypothetical protein
MKLEIFSVYDSKAAAYLPPFYLPQIGMATRIFQNCANDKGHQFGANPGDYALFHLGQFDDNSAIIETKPTPENLGLAQEFKDSPRIPEPAFNEKAETATEINEGKN